MSIDRFYDEHVEKVYKFFYVKSLNKGLAEDLTSDTFVKFVSQYKQKSIKDNTKYLYGIMRTVWIEFLKDKYKAKIVELEHIENFEDYSTDIVGDFEESEGPINRLQPYVDMLPEKQRQVLTMRIFEERSVSETAEALGKDSNYVKTTHQRALRSLRQILDNPYLPSREEAQS